MTATPTSSSSSTIAAVIALVAITGISGCKQGASIEVSSPDIVALGSSLAVKKSNDATLNVQVTAGDEQTLKSFSISSSANADLNDTRSGLSGTQFSNFYRFTPSVEKSEVKLSAVSVSTTDGKDIKASKTYDVYKVVPYMNDNARQFLSIQYPEAQNANRSAILFIRGTAQDFTYFYPNAEDAAAAGYVTVSMDFRDFLDAPINSLPDQIEDVRCAIQYMKANSAELNIDPNNIGVVGYSVGAAFGLLTAYGTTADLPNKPDYASRCRYSGQTTDVKAVVAMSAPNDMLYQMGTYSSSITDAEARERTEKLFGITKNGSKFIKEDYEAYYKNHPGASQDDWRNQLRSNTFPQDAAEKAALKRDIVRKLDAYSPLNYLGDRSIPLYIMHGKNDSVFPCEQAIRNVNAANRSNVFVYVFTASSDDHLWQGYDAPPKRTARENYTAFFDRYVTGENVNVPTMPVSCNI